MGLFNGGGYGKKGGGNNKWILYLAVGFIAIIAIAAIGLANMSSRGVGDTSIAPGCNTGFFTTGASETNGTLIIQCTQVGWTQLTGYPSPCASNQFVTQVAGTLTCSAVSWAGLTNFPSGCSPGQFVMGVGVSLTCSAVGWTTLTGFPSACSSGFFVTAVGPSLTCTLPDPICSNGMSSLTCLAPMQWWTLTEGSGTMIHNILSSEFMTEVGAGTPPIWEYNHGPYMNPNVGFLDNTTHFLSTTPHSWFGNQSYTITQWVYWNGTTDAGRNDLKGIYLDNNVNFGTSLLFTPGNQAFIHAWWSGCATSIGSNVAPNQWHYIVVTYNATAVRYAWMDGVFQGTDNSCASVGPMNVVNPGIGVDFSALTGVTMKLADLRIYAGSLSIAQQLTIEQEMLQHNFPAGSG